MRNSKESLLNSMATDHKQLVLPHEYLKEVTFHQQDAKKDVQFNSHFSFIKSYPMQIYVEGIFEDIAVNFTSMCCKSK